MNGLRNNKGLTLKQTKNVLTHDSYFIYYLGHNVLKYNIYSFFRFPIIPLQRDMNRTL